jgi:Ran GTPase-activating protein (RanGAP) involved in mRNA processing and transport
MQSLRVFNSRNNSIKGDLKGVFNKLIAGSNLKVLGLDKNDLTREAGLEILEAIKSSYDLESCSL